LLEETHLFHQKWREDATGFCLCIYTKKSR
jgi:hypothetical protein